MLCPIHVLRYSSARRVVAQGVTDQTELPKHTVVLPVLTSPMKKLELNSKAGRQLQVCVRVCGVVVWVCGGMVVWWRGGVVVWGAVVGVVVAAAVAGVVNVRAQQQGRQAGCTCSLCGRTNLYTAPRPRTHPRRPPPSLSLMVHVDRPTGCPRERGSTGSAHPAPDLGHHRGQGLDHS